jgi:hypothetical protein
MNKLLHIIFTTLAINMTMQCDGQNPMLEVKSFEYIWQNKYTLDDMPFISDDNVNATLRNSFAKAIQNRWDVEFPKIVFSVKNRTLYIGKPSFNTKLKTYDPEKWYLFLTIFDNENNPHYKLNENSNLKILELRCLLKSGHKDSVIFERALTVKLHREETPTNPIFLKLLPAHYPDYVRAFDSIALWLFQKEPVDQKSILLKPACVFIPPDLSKPVIEKLTYRSTETSIRKTNEPEFLLVRNSPKFKKVGIQRNTMGNIASGALTLLTGIGTTKHKTYEYNAMFNFDEDEKQYSCTINYYEEERKEMERVRNKNNDGSKSSYISSSERIPVKRFTDNSNVNSIMLNKDTLALFKIIHVSKESFSNQYDQMWDGSDSSTVMPLPARWNNKSAESEVYISGSLMGIHFYMKTKNETRTKEFYLNDQHVFTIHGKYEPSKAEVFKPVSTEQLKVFTILSSIPYSYFNVNFN